MATRSIGSIDPRALQIPARRAEFSLLHQFFNLIFTLNQDTSSRNRRNQRGVKRKMSNFPVRRGYKRSPLIDFCAAIRIVK